MIIEKKYKEALDIFVEKHKKNINVIAILVSGSIIHSKPDKNSDLDVHIILRESASRERGNTWINGVEVEYFINPINQIEHYFKTEINAPHTAHMLANSLVLYKKDNTIDRLICRAKIAMSKKLPKMSKVGIENAKYHIDDIRKDLEDVYLKEDLFAFNLTFNRLLSECLKIFYEIKQEPIEKSKRIESSIEKIDDKFKNIFVKANTEIDMVKKYDLANAVVEYTEKLLGGKRSKEWKIKGKLTIGK